MAVRILMSLEGVDKVTGGFAEAQKAGEDMMRSITGLSDQDPLKGFSLSIGSATQAMGEHGRAVSGVTEAYHILAPLLREVGVSVGELRGLSILARDSFLGLAAVVGAGVAIGLAKLEEQTAQLKGTLTDLAGGSKAGQQAFDDLTKSAATLGTSVGALAPGLEAAIVALQRFQATSTTAKFVAFDTANLPAALNSIKVATDAYTNFILLLRAGRLDEGQAETAAKSFFTTLGSSGKLTSDLLRQLPVGTVDELAKALGHGGEQTQVFIAEVDRLNISTAKAEQALAAYKAQSQNAFDTKAIITFNDELKKTAEIFLTEFTKAFGEPFSDFVLQELRRIQEGIKSTSTDIQNLTKVWNALKEATTPEAVASEFDVFGTAAIDKQIAPSLLDKFLEIQTGFHAVAADAINSLNQVGAAGTAAGGALGSAFKNAQAEASKFGQFVSGDILPEVLKVGDATRNTLIFQGFIPGGATVTAPEPTIPLPKPKPEDLQASTQPIIDANQKAEDEVAAIWLKAGFDINTGIDTGLQENPVDFAPLEDAFKTTGQQLASDAQAIWNNVKAVLSQPINIPTTVTAPGGAPFASGGLITGPGSGTSDSIMAMLSNREFVVNARSTEFYGPGFFAALNAMLVPRDILPGFAAGGLVKAFATAPGAQTARTPINLIIDRQSFAMTATEDVAHALSQLSVGEQLAAGGRKPGWSRS